MPVGSFTVAVAALTGVGGLTLNLFLVLSSMMTEQVWLKLVPLTVILSPGLAAFGVSDVIWQEVPVMYIENPWAESGAFPSGDVCVDPGASGSYTCRYLYLHCQGAHVGDGRSKHFTRDVFEGDRAKGSKILAVNDHIAIDCCRLRSNVPDLAGRSPTLD